MVVAYTHRYAKFWLCTCSPHALVYGTFSNIREVCLDRTLGTQVIEFIAFHAGICVYIAKFLICVRGH